MTQFRIAKPCLLNIRRVALVVAVLLCAISAYAAEVHVFAAASLSDSLKEIATAYEKQTGDKVVFNFGASSLLARQIEEGAPGGRILLS